MRFLKNKTFLTFFAVWLAAGAFSIHLRLYPLRTHTSPDAAEKATMLVLNDVRKQILDNVSRNHPGLSMNEKNLLVKQAIDQTMRDEGEQMRRTIARVAKEIEADLSDERYRRPYLLASDGYYYFSLTENIARTGKLAAKIKGSKYFNELMLHPLGHWEPVNFHPYVGYFVYRIVKVFVPDASLEFGVSFTPLFVVGLALIPFLILCRMLGCGALAAFTGAMFLLNSSFLLKRTMFAWYDNDPYGILFLLSLFACLFYSLQNRTDRKKCAAGGLMSAGVISVYALFWHGWVFFLGNIAAGGVLCLLYSLFVLRDGSVKNIFFFLLAVNLGTFAGISLMFGPGEFFVLFQEGFKALTDFTAPGLALWPDLYIGVGELNKPSLNYLIDLSGGYVVFLGALGGAAVYFLRSWHGKNGNPLWMIMMAVLLASSTLISLGAMRFTFLLAIVLGALFPFAVQQALEYARDHSVIKHKTFAVGMNILAVGVVTALSLSFAHQSAPGQLNRIYNPIWEKALTTIRDKTPPDSVVNTWWPPGHFIKAVAKRRVTFDGATINKPQGYWLANFFLARNEQAALGILRMLNNSANQAAEFLTAGGMPLSQAARLLYKITPMNRKDAEDFLKDKLSSDDTAELLKLTHARPPPSYIMLTNEQIEKNLQYKFIGGWNIEKVEKINADPAKLRSIPKPGSQNYIDFLWNLSGGPYDASPVLGLLSRQGDILAFEKNIKINMKTKETVIHPPDGRAVYPRSILYLDGDEIVEKRFPGAAVPYSVLLFVRDRQHGCMLLDAELGRSTLMRLYFFEGKGLKYFEPLVLANDLSGRTQIKVFKVKWDAFLRDIGDL